MKTYEVTISLRDFVCEVEADDRSMAVDAAMERLAQGEVHDCVCWKQAIETGTDGE